ncbi:MAG TPA: hypothetical protein QF764_13015 [Planctomycetota bacterium]|nr:hypothetical protein [Planctomycetota bacterium]
MLRFLRHLALAVTVAVLTALAVEGGQRLWLAAHGELYSARAMRDTLLEALSEATADVPLPGDVVVETEARRKTQLRPHPYLGFNADFAIERLERDLKSHGMERRDTFSVLIVGGSVAAGFSHMGLERMTERLNADPRLADQKVRALAYARGGFKQPQQLITVGNLLGLGMKPDVVLNIDGFNEMAIGNANVVNGFHPLYPSHSHWTPLLLAGSAGLPALEQYAALARAREDLGALVQRTLDSGVHHSSILGRHALMRVQRLRGEMAAATTTYIDLLESDDLEPYLTGPALLPGQGGYRVTGRNWYECSLSLHAMCERRSILYLHLLQPTLHLPGSKPLTEAEIAGGHTGPDWIEGVQTGYPILRARGRQLQDAGVPFIDASMLFAEVNEELYYDACHFGVAGHERLADVVVNALLEALPD